MRLRRLREDLQGRPIELQVLGLVGLLQRLRADPQSEACQRGLRLLEDLARRRSPTPALARCEGASQVEHTMAKTVLAMMSSLVLRGGAPSPSKASVT